ncbi:MAG: carbonic anhydrase family protein [Propionibacteriaceae bacterium]|nr:carbonic anhydrase family protein [Propionibacteriaceae bacterium]
MNGAVQGNQSPIDIDSRAAVPAAGMPELHFEPTAYRLDGTHYMPAGDQNWIILDGVTYRLVQMHFHRPSEHYLDGRQFAGEMHAVCQSDDGGTAVVGVLLSRTDGVIDLAATPVNLAAVVPDGRVFRYDGSLTTPPFTEGVKWVVYEAPVELPWACVSAGARALQPKGATLAVTSRP